jgi:hypothetical protein
MDEVAERGPLKFWTSSGDLKKWPNEISWKFWTSSGDPKK